MRLGLLGPLLTLAAFVGQARRSARLGAVAVVRGLGWLTEQLEQRPRAAGSFDFEGGVVLPERSGG